MRTQFDRRYLDKYSGSGYFIPEIYKTCFVVAHSKANSLANTHNLRHRMRLLAQHRYNVFQEAVHYIPNNSCGSYGGGARTCHV